MENIIAQVPVNVGQPINAIGNIGNPETGGAPSLFAQIISIIIGLITLIAFIWFIFLLISGAISYMSAGGDKVKIEAARKRITTGLIGVVIVVAGIFIVRLIATLLGLGDILDIEAMINLVSP
ncbi:MAG: hypothetical protein BMS9Abin21_142 [Thermodesulfovibrionia bacterium]|nr:MAG: hypothetical protein BMS9Abin21_142 [Thermodesulfovibrionia bacterium]